MNNQAQGAGEPKVESVDIKEYIAVLLKRKWLILVCFLLSMAGTTAFLFTRQPVYRAITRMLVTRSGGAIPLSDVSREDDRSFYGTQISIMNSSTMQQRVLTRLKKTVEEVRDNLRNFLVTQMPGSDIISIAVDSPSKDFARDYANAVADEYLKFRDEQRAQTSESALLMLTREINRLSQELKAANERVTNYMKEHNLAGTEQLTTTQYREALTALTSAGNQLADMKTKRQLLESRPSVASALAVLAAERPPPAADNAPAKTVAKTDAAAPPSASDKPAAKPTDTASIPGTTDAADEGTAAIDGGGVNRSTLWAVTASSAQRLFDLEHTERNLKAKLADLAKHYKPKHPTIVETEKSLLETEDSIAAEMQMVREKTDADLKMAQVRYDKAKANFDKLSAETLRDNAENMELTTLKDDANRIQSLYNTLLGQLMKIDMSQNFNERNVSVLEQAILLPDPVYPKKGKGLLVAAFVGIGLGLALAFFIEYIDDSIKLAEEVERDLQLPFLGMVPAAEWNPDDYSAHRLDKLKQQGGVAEAYRVVRSAIIFSVPREKLRSLLVTSAVPREGKTTTCVNMAIGFSQIEDRVLLVDADLRRGEVQKYFGMERGKGLVDVLLGEATPEEAIRQTNVPKLDVLTCGAYPANPAELLLGWRLKEFLEWGYKHYNRVIIDCPPVMGIADSAILGAAVDGVLLVIWAGRTSRRYVRVAKMTAVSRGAKIFGFMLNNLEPGRVGYYHYYPYYYSYYSRGYYYAHKEDDQSPADPPTGAEGQDAAAKPAAGKSVEVSPTKPDDEAELDDVY